MFGGISIWQLVIVLLLVVLLFGTKKLRNLGNDLGSAFKGFKKSMGSDEENADGAVVNKINDDKKDTTTAQAKKDDAAKDTSTADATASANNTSSASSSNEEVKASSSATK